MQYVEHLFQVLSEISVIFINKNNINILFVCGIHPGYVSTGVVYYILIVDRSMINVCFFHKCCTTCM